MSVEIARTKPVVEPTPDTKQHVCDCIHYDELTCIARQHNMSRFNASIVFATSTKSERNGRCICKCHRDKNDQPVSEQAWRRRGIKATRKQVSEVQR